MRLLKYQGADCELFKKGRIFSEGDRLPRWLRRTASKRKGSQK
jgi:hypothetical protein